MSSGMLRIGELAKQVGVSTSMLRYYEEQGLLSPTDRTEAGYRVYGPSAAGRIGFIQRAKSLGLTLREIRQLVQEPAESSTELARLRHAIAHKLADTRQRIAELEGLRRELETLYLRLSRGAAPCGHIGDCECWLPTEKEVKQMMAEVREAQGCSCCGCTCPSDGGACTCCGCPCP